MFFKIWKLFKHSIKKEIFIYIETALVKIMNSSNATFLHKKTVLENLMNQEFFYFLELYVNYDYDLNEKFIIYNLISIFSDIIKGRFYKNSKNNNSFTEQENNELINYALKILSLILQSIFDFSSKIFQENNKKKDSDKNINLLYTFSSNNKKQNQKQQFYTDKQNLTDNLNNKNYNSAITDKNYPESNESINRQTINEENIKELLNTQRIRNSNTNLSMNNNDNIRKNSDYEIAVKKFNKKYEYGLAYLKMLGYININTLEEKAKDINNFLTNAEKINKINLFEFLGENTELSNKVLEYFLDNFNFSNMNIVDTVKIFFGMTLPFSLCSARGGEKFENVLKFFSKKYFKDNISNNNILLNEESIFYISYIIIILIHSEKKIELNEFVELVNNILINNNQKIIEEDFLKNIYNSINKEFDINNSKLNSDIDINNLKKIKIDFNKEIIYKENKYKIIHKEDMNEYLYQLTLSIWKKLAVTCNIIIEESNDENIYKKGIYGIVYIIKILGLMELEQQKQTVISLICFMSNLLQIKIIKEKNIFCIKQILNLANGDFRFCKGGWDSILKIINKLHFYYLLDTMTKNEKDEIIQKLKNSNIEKENYLNYLHQIITKKFLIKHIISIMKP